MHFPLSHYFVGHFADLYICQPFMWDTLDRAFSFSLLSYLLATVLIFPSRIETKLKGDTVENVSNSYLCCRLLVLTKLKHGDTEMQQYLILFSLVHLPQIVLSCCSGLSDLQFPAAITCAEHFIGPCCF